MSNKRSKRREQDSTATASHFDRRHWLLAAFVGLTVAQILLPADSVSAIYGASLPLTMLWLALVVVWFLARLGERDHDVHFGICDLAVLVFISLHTVSAVWATTQAAPRTAAWARSLWARSWLGEGPTAPPGETTVSGPHAS